MKENNNPPSIYVTSIDLSLAEKILHDLKEQDFEITTPPYTLFSAKKKGVSCTLYKSGKLTVQGKGMQEFVEFYVEPQVLGTFHFRYQDQMLDTLVDPSPRIGIDESGKGDFFGPLCIAGVFAEGDSILELKKLGVKDSKNISDPLIIKIGNKIKASYRHHIVKINPAKYNELYSQFGNLNTMLAWGHATAIEQLVEETKCKNVIIDQFADERVVIKALKRKNLEVLLTQKHRAEEDVVVAAASILARQTFLEGLEKLGQEMGVILPKGASAATIKMGKQIFSKLGREGLAKIGKLHFKTLGSIIGIITQ
jgi:ribonuclease HIII